MITSELDMDNEVDSTLLGDPKRQAVASLQGYAYQIWQSVYRWLHLRTDQALVLEGAEDIDLMGPGKAESIQVKVSGPISLRSEHVLASIDHFWGHQQNNPELSVSFRLLTTAERTFERSRPFGETRGLDYWDLCKFPQTDPNPLRAFLGDQEKLPADLRQFIKESSDEDFREQLVARIAWDTSNKPLSLIADLVKDKVVNYGYEVHFLPPSDSEKVIPHLLKHVWDVVLESNNRRLFLSDFMRLFEEAVSERISKSELRQLRNIALLRNSISGSSDKSNGLDSIFETVTPPLNDRLVPRSKLISSLLPSLNSNRVLALSGSSGMGKSILANIVASVDRTRWRKLSVRGLAPNEIRDRLRYATNAIEEHPIGTSFIIDDLNFDREPLVYEELLAKFIYAVILRSGRILITTQGALPMRIMTLHDLPNGCNVEIPTLEEDEIRDLAVNHGCPSGHQLKAWTRIIAIQTSRHPLLAHARIKGLEARGWPGHTECDLGAPDELEEIRREIRAHLRELLPSQEARILAYRLSIIAGRFRRHDALSFGQHDPSIKVPGEAFDSLIGPWVERAGEHYFRLSPLLDGAAEENFTPDEVRELHRTAAHSFISLGTIGPIELGSILFHGLISDAIEPLARAAMSTFRVEDEYWPDLSAVLDWFAHCRVEPGEKLLPGNPLVSTLLRRLQFKIVSKSGGQRALAVAVAWEHEIDEWDGSDSYAGSHEATHLIFFTDILFSFDTPVEIKKIVGYLARAIALGKASDHFFPGYEPIEFSKEDLSRVFNAHTLLGVAIARCRTASAVVEFLTAVEELSSNDSSVIQQILKDDDRLAALFIDQMWIAEAKITNPNWNDCLSKIEWVIEFALAKGLTAVAVASYRAKATVLEEYLHDSDAALNVIGEGEATVGSKHPVLEDYRAKILVMEKRFEEALSVWEGTMSDDSGPANPVRTFSHRDAEICAGQLGDWKKAGEFALEGVMAAQQMLRDVVPENFNVPEIELMVTGFKADHAYALWRCNNREAAVKCFIEILDALAKLPNPNDNLKANMLHRRVGYAIGWLNHDIVGNVDVIEPPPGCFSNPEVHELVKELPMQPLEGLWFLLAKVEYRLDIGDGVFQRFGHLISDTSPSSLRAGYADLLLDHTLRSSKLESLVSTFTRCLTDVRTYAAEQGVKQDQLSISLVLTSYLFAVLVKLIRRDEYAVIPVSDWRKEAIEQGINSEALNSWLTFVEGSITANLSDLVRTVHEESSATEIRLTAALLVSVSMDSNPEDRFYANVVLATTNFYDNWLREIESDISSMISETWLFVSERQRFALLSPNLNTETIASACKDESCCGLKKVARVLLAVRSAVRTSLSEDIFLTLKEKAGYL